MWLSVQVLVQEFLVGTEYVVDTVSRDGEHKVQTGRQGDWERERQTERGRERQRDRQAVALVRAGSSIVYFSSRLTCAEDRFRNLFTR